MARWGSPALSSRSLVAASGVTAIVCRESIPAMLDLRAQERVVRFAPAHQARLTGTHDDDRRSRHHVVVARHRQVVRAGHGDREEIARPRTREPYLTDEDVA